MSTAAPWGNPKPGQHTIVGLKRWSVKAKEIPSVAGIKAIHVYDFDNTLFSTPLPNPQLWYPPTIGQLQTYECFATGGWWHDASILAATGDGLEKEEPRAWSGWWNEAILQLVDLSLKSKEVLTVLLTGRSETNFADLIKRIVDSKKLDFDLVCLKPEVGPQGQRFATTIEFKQELLREVVCTYKNADELRVYEDRIHHVKGFREYFERLNKSLLSHTVDEPPPPRKPITTEVIHVCEMRTMLNQEVEVQLVHRLINQHNDAILKGGPNPHRAAPKLWRIVEHFVYCGYLINQNDSARLITLVNAPVHLIDSGDLKLLASSILISPKPAPRHILDKVGGKGKKVTWQVTGVAKFEDRIWAARVEPVSEKERIHTQDPTPFVVLALRKGTRPIDASRIQNWQPVPPEKAFIFETVVGDKVMLKLEEDDYMRNGGDRQVSSNDGPLKRKLGNQDEWRGKENFPNPSNPRPERNDDTWLAKGRPGYPNDLHPGGGRHGQERYFHSARNNDTRNFSGNRGGRGGAGGGRRQDQQNMPQKQGDRPRGGGGGRGRGGNRGPPGYKSLDDYGPGGFDGSAEMRGGASGDMVMNY